MDCDLLINQLKIHIKPSKADEFIDSVSSLLRNIRKEKDCLGCSVYQNLERKNSFIVFGEWKTEQAMEKHFMTHEFELLIGAARVLGETYTMNIAQATKTGTLNWPENSIKRYYTTTKR